MNFELFIASRLKLNKSSDAGSPGMNIALIGIMLAIIVMILSIAIVMGFKHEITDKIYQLDPHLRVSNAALGLDENYNTVNARNIDEAISPHEDFINKIHSISLIAEKPAILKTDENFIGVQYRGVDKRFDWTYIESRLVDGRVPNLADSANTSEIIISQVVANSLKLKNGDKILTYFIDNDVKVRNSLIVGIYSTDFEEFDKSYIMGNIALLQNVNGWNGDTGNFVAINLNDISHASQDAYTLFSILAQDCYSKENNLLHNVSHTFNNNQSFFSWLSMLDMNVIIILVLMMIVSGFTLISALLMIILERIKMIGTLKALGCTNGAIRRIFILLTQKIIFKALIIGNITGLGLALIQKYFHVIKLNAEVYYMPYVPISIDVWSIVILNVAVIVASYVTLVGPSYIISTIKPTATMRFD